VEANAALEPQEEIILLPRLRKTLKGFLPLLSKQVLIYFLHLSTFPRYWPKRITSTVQLHVLICYDASWNKEPNKLGRI
jgi:hypothetical protein